jgi:UDP-N-acetylmuramate--alanine ligase
MVGVSVDLRALSRVGPVHFMGAGGAGMCALAELLLREGGHVTGCDLKDSPSLRSLEALGATVHPGHDPSHSEHASALVVTSAVPQNHPEILRAQELGVPVLKRAQALGSWVNRGRVLAVAGTHGKTTTTAMAADMLAAAGQDPTGLVGGRVSGWGGNLRHGGGDLYVVEADEYDRSFHTLAPDVAVVTNMETDHLDIYGDLEGVRRGFRTFLEGMRDGGRVVACADDRGAASLLSEVGGSGYSYGLSAGSCLRAVDVRVGPSATSCRVWEDGVDVGLLTVALGGLHNLRNALGAAAAVRSLGAGWDAIRSSMAEFRGVGRRFEHLGEVAGVRIVDDYAHHPTEIEATLAAARAAYPESRLVAAFQPHLYSRTRDFSDAFGTALAGADVVWVTDVFPAREAPVPGVTGALVADAARQAGATQVRYHPLVEDLAEALASTLAAGDVLLTLGAGSVESVGVEVLQILEGRAHA